MNIRAVILCSYLLVTFPLFARDNTDVIVMKNGDHFTCQIKALNGGTLYVSFSYAIETLSVDWSEVASLESNQLFLVKTESGSVYHGSLGTKETSTDRPIDIEVIETPENKVVLNSEKIVEVSTTSEKFHQRFNGGIGLGFIFAKANESAQYSLNGLAAYPRERWAAQAGILSNLSSSTGSTTSTRNQLTFEAMHLLPRPNYFVGGFDGFLQSSEEGISGQNTLGGGLGRYLKNTNRTIFAVLVGAAWQHTQYNPTVFSIPTQDSATGVIRANLRLLRFNKTNLTVTALALPFFTDPGRINFSTNASYYVKLGGNVTWNVSFYGSWDNHPPQNLPGSDYGSTVGLNWTFGTSLRTTPATIP
jgi:putative salt-induced outer membrane protein YdiY